MAGPKNVSLQRQQGFLKLNFKAKAVKRKQTIIKVVPQKNRRSNVCIVRLPEKIFNIPLISVIIQTITFSEEMCLQFFLKEINVYG
jgi:hypothetical protein